MTFLDTRGTPGEASRLQDCRKSGESRTKQENETAVRLPGLQKGRRNMVEVGMEPEQVRYDVTGEVTVKVAGRTVVSEKEGRAHVIAYYDGPAPEEPLKDDPFVALRARLRDATGYWVWVGEEPGGVPGMIKDVTP